MGKFTGEVGLLASPFPGFVERQHPFPILMEHKGALRMLGEVILPLAVKDVKEDLWELNKPAPFVLCRATIQHDRVGI